MNYTFLILPFVSLFLAQFIKLGLFSRNGKFSWKDFDSYGGMPSSHSAFMGTALIESMQLYGVNSPIFAIIVFITFIVLRDAVGLRMTIGKHASMINKIVQALPHEVQNQYPHLEPRQGHTYEQVAVGLILGITIGLLIN